MVSALCVVLTACQSVARQGGSEQHVDSPKLPNVQPNNSNRLKEDLSQGLSVENNSGYVPDDTGHTSTNVLVSNAASVDNCEINIPDELSTKQGVYSTEALLKWEVARLHLQLDCMKAMQGLVPVNVKPATATVSVEPIQSKNTLADRWRPASRSDDRDLDGVLDHLDRCPDTEESITVGKNGCGLFDEILHDVKFSRASVFLSNEARAQLDGVAEMLLAFPESGVLIRVHTDSTGTPAENLAISARRANIIAQYLLSKGVGESQLRASGLGDLEPIASNDTEEGRIKNHRVDLVTLPDRDTEQGQQLAEIAVAVANTNTIASAAA